jgi:3-dehydroquinate dehydratase/shikimate dehydrogenase
MMKICVPVCVDRFDKMREAVKRASQFADLVELRLDYLDDIDAASKSLRELIETIRRPVILTLRSGEQGGKNSFDYDRRRQFWLSLKDIPGSTFCDIELDLVLEFSAQAMQEQLPFSWDRTICSHHDFSGTSSDLEQVYERMAATPAAIIKIAVQANDAVDCLAIFRLLERAQREHRELIAIAMGQPGIMTRILGPSRGSFLTYASIDQESTTAAGQVTAADLREVYRIDQIDRETQIFGIIGNPVSHSLSPRIHNAALAAASLNAVFIPFEVHEVKQFIRQMVHPKSRELDWDLRGLSVTAPHKSTVMNTLDWIDPAARDIGAVNTIVVRNDQLLGYNTDAAGFIAPLRRAFGSLDKARCAIVGAGGAARAVLWALRNEGANITLFARNLDKGKELSTQFSAASEPLVNARFEKFDIVINATPLGTRGEQQDETVATADQLRGVRLAYDLVYNPIETRFIREARDAGCETLGGIEMLLAQAVAQFKLWTGHEPDAETMREAARRGLS